jgi:predicted MFS family arabinose efflux permease
VALVLGCADLCGSVGVSLITDRIGKRRGTLIGLAGALLGFALLPLVNSTLLLTVAVLAVGRAFFEFGIVSHISLVSEQVPSQRGKMVTLSFTCGLFGNTFSSFSGPTAYLHYGVGGLSSVAAATIAVSLILLLGWVKEVET